MNPEYEPIEIDGDSESRYKTIGILKCIL